MTTKMEYKTGRLYHCKWAKKKGMCWRLVSFSVEENTAKLVTPVTGKILVTQLDQLYNTNGHDFDKHKKWRSHAERKQSNE